MGGSYFYEVKRMFLFLAVIACFLSSKGQQNYPIYQDSSRIRLKQVVIVDHYKYAKGEGYRYNQMKFYVGHILPYVDRAVKMFHDIETETANMSRRQKRQYIKGRRHEIKVNFENKLRSLNKTQGRYLVKAINRNLGTSV